MSTNNTSILHAVRDQVTDPPEPRAETVDKLWQALWDNPGSTATALSTTAGIGKSTAPKILTRGGSGIGDRTTALVHTHALGSAAVHWFLGLHPACRGPDERRQPLTGSARSRSPLGANGCSVVPGGRCRAAKGVTFAANATVDSLPRMSGTPDAASWCSQRRVCPSDSVRH
jgi:hypothetical protein